MIAFHYSLLHYLLASAFLLSPVLAIPAPSSSGVDSVCRDEACDSYASDYVAKSRRDERPSNVSDQLSPRTGHLSTRSSACNDVKGFDPDLLATADNKRRRSWDDQNLSGNRNVSILEELRMLDKRASSAKQPYQFCVGDAVMSYTTLGYPSGTTLYDNKDWSDCNNFVFGVQTTDQAGHKYIDEHILERQMLQIFLGRYVEGQPGLDTFPSLCKYVKNYWDGPKGIIAAGATSMKAWDYVATAFPSTKDFGTEMVRLEEEVNLAKERAFKFGVAINAVDKMNQWLKVETDAGRVVKNLKVTLLAVKYMDIPAVNHLYLTQGNRVGDYLANAEVELSKNWGSAYKTLHLQTKWKAFMKEYTDEVRDKFEAYLNLWIGSLDFHWGKNAGPPPTPSRKTLADNIANLETAIDGVRNTVFKNPF